MEEKGEDGEGCGMRSRAPGEGGCAHPRERCTPPPHLVATMTSCLQGDPKPRPPIPPRGLSGPPRPAEGVIGVGTLTSMRGEEEKRRRGEEEKKGGGRGQGESASLKQNVDGA